MFKNRYFILGLGLGFIICGILLILYGGSFISENSDELTVEEIKAIGYDNNLYIYTEEELNEIIILSIENEENNNATKNNNLIEGQSIKFTIPYGSDSDEVVELLYSNNLIDDKQEFYIMLANNYLTKKIISGDYECNSGISDKELIELITNTKISN